MADDPRTFFPEHYLQCLQHPKTPDEEDEERRAYQKCLDLMSTLPQETRWGEALHLREFQGFWIPEVFFPGVMAFRDRLKPRPEDVLLASYMKTGTGWQRALAFTTINRGDRTSMQITLRTRHAQDLAFFLESIFGFDRYPDLDVLPSPRLLATHVPYSLLPECVKGSRCPMVYICRDPKDTLVSMWHFMEKLKPEAAEPLPFVEAFELFCAGASPYGPFWDHVLEYWNESLRRPEKVLFLKYEELKAEPASNVRRLAEFLGCPFTEEEERDGVVEEIIGMCSFENLSSLAVNTEGEKGPTKNASFFRRGQVGDWANHLTPEMARRLDGISAQKLQGSGLSFTAAAELEACDGHGPAPFPLLSAP